MVEWDDHSEDVVTGRLNSEKGAKLNMTRLKSEAATYRGTGPMPVISKHVDDEMLIARTVKEYHETLSELRKHLMIEDTGPQGGEVLGRPHHDDREGLPGEA